MSDFETRLRNLNLHGVLAHLDETRDQPWLDRLLGWEEQERARRGLERRLRLARLGAYKPMADFDWSWPKRVDRAQLDDLFRLEWLASATNVVLIGPNGVGKTMIAKNLAYQAVLGGSSAVLYTASELLNTLADQSTSQSLHRKLAAVCRPQLLVLDELGYLSYDSRHADLLFEVVSRRYQMLRPILLTTNKPFAQWADVFPNATSVVTLVDRLVHRCELLHVEADSYRLKESRENARLRAQQRAKRAKP